MKLGFFGGAFDPFHTEHEKVIEAAQSELLLDAVVLVPSQNPPHKDSPVTDFADRATMLALWAKSRKGIIIDTVEAETGYEKNRSFEIINLLKQRHRADQYYYIIGGDSMINFHTWINPEIIAKEIALAVVSREGFAGVDNAIEAARRDYGADIIKLAAIGKEVSSGEIKARLELGMDASGLINGRIQEYIKKRKLYREYGDLVDKLRASVSPALFDHCARTAVFAARHATAAKVSYGKAFVTGLLHDCAKEMSDDIADYPTDAPKVVHQYKGAEIAAREYGITDSEILDAIACHTTGKPAMSALDKLIYIADKLEDGREFEGIEELRNELKSGLDSGFLSLIAHSAAHLQSRGIKADGLTNECRKYYYK